MLLRGLKSANRQLSQIVLSALACFGWPEGWAHPLQNLRGFKSPQVGDYSSFLCSFLDQRFFEFLLSKIDLFCLPSLSCKNCRSLLLISSSCQI